MIDLRFYRDGGQSAVDVANQISEFLDAARTSLELALYDIRLHNDAAEIVTQALVGAQEAAALLLTGGWMGAQQAERSGLAWKVTGHMGLMEEALAMSDAIAAHPLDALVATKRLLLAARADAVRAAREREQREYSQLLEALSTHQSAPQATEKGDP